MINASLWKEFVRDGEGYWEKYKGIRSSVTGENYFPGPQPYSWYLQNQTKVVNYLDASIKTRKKIVRILEGKAKLPKSPKEFTKWLINLQKSQSYKGSPGKIRSNTQASNNQTKVIIGDVIKIAKKLKDPYFSGKSKGPIFDNIPTKAQPRDIYISKDLIKHYYPNPKYFKYYEREMYSAFKESVLLIKSKSNKIPSLQKIAYFYQLGINSHLFEQVNNSLLMNILNSYLHALGLNGIEHGILDFVSMRLQPENFLKYLLKEVKHQNLGKKIA